MRRSVPGPPGARSPAPRSPRHRCGGGRRPARGGGVARDERGRGATPTSGTSIPATSRSPPAAGRPRPPIRAAARTRADSSTAAIAPSIASGASGVPPIARTRISRAVRAERACCGPSRRASHPRACRRPPRGRSGSQGTASGPGSRSSRTPGRTATACGRGSLAAWLTASGRRLRLAVPPDVDERGTLRGAAPLVEIRHVPAGSKRVDSRSGIMSGRVGAVHEHGDARAPPASARAAPPGRRARWGSSRG